MRRIRWFFVYVRSATKVENAKLTLGRSGVGVSNDMWLHFADCIKAHGEDRKIEIYVIQVTQGSSVVKESFSFSPSIGTMLVGICVALLHRRIKLVWRLEGS